MSRRRTKQTIRVRAIKSANKGGSVPLRVAMRKLAKSGDGAAEQWLKGKGMR